MKTQTVTRQRTAWSSVRINGFYGAKLLFGMLVLSLSAQVASADGVSQKFTGDDEIAERLDRVLPTLPYTTSDLSQQAKKVNASSWQAHSADKMDKAVGAKVQAMLDWHHHSVGAIDGLWGKNTRKAMNAFQQRMGLDVTDAMNQETWDALTKDTAKAKQPVLVNYTLKDGDINIKTTRIPTDTKAKGELDGMYYESVLESLAEKFQMDTSYLNELNPNAKFVSGETITVFNPGMPNTTAVSKVIADKSTQTVYAYDKEDNMVASYPSTVGSDATPSPSGTHQVKVKVHKPNYTYSHDDGGQTIIPPGPNNPVGLVWIGLTKPTFGIHGSPDPERISRQASSGCVRLTNWDALALYGTIGDDATVVFR